MHTTTHPATLTAFVLSALALPMAPTALANTYFEGTGTAQHDARSVACRNAERAARLDAARQAEGFVHQVVQTSWTENQHGLQQSRQEFIEQTVYGLATLQGNPIEQAAITADQTIECRVQARYRFDSDAIQQHYRADQARQARQAGHDSTLARLQQELADNQHAYQRMQQHLAPSRHGSGSYTTYCPVAATANQCEALLQEVIAQPYLQQYAAELGIDRRLLQPSLQLQGRMEFTELNSQLKQVDWQGDYQLTLQLNDPFSARNQQLQREIRQLRGQPFLAEPRAHGTDSAATKPALHRLAVTLGSDCMLGCSSSYLEPKGKPLAGNVRGNFIQARLALTAWLQFNGGIYQEHYSLCLDEIAGRFGCSNIQSASAWYPAVGFTLRQQWAYLEAMHLFSISDTDLQATTLSKGYQRFELGLSTRQDRKGWTGAIGMSSRLMPAGTASWDGWDLVFSIGYVF